MPATHHSPYATRGSFLTESYSASALSTRSFSHAGSAAGPRTGVASLRLIGATIARPPERPPFLRSASRTATFRLADRLASRPGRPPPEVRDADRGPGFRRHRRRQRHRARGDAGAAAP